MNTLHETMKTPAAIPDARTQGGALPGAGGRARAVLAAAMLALALSLGAQVPGVSPFGQPATTAAPTAATPATPTGLPRGYRGIELGMSLDEVEAILAKDPWYGFRGPEDVSLLAIPNMSLIEVIGISFVRRGFFQFHEGRLWVMILSLDPGRMDHYSTYTTLAGKYGEPGYLDPKESRWEDGTTRIALERPLTLRYLDLGVLAALRDASLARESVEELERRDFLGGL